MIIFCIVPCVTRQTGYLVATQLLPGHLFPPLLSPFFSYLITSFQGLSGVHPERDEHGVVALPVRPGGRRRARHPNGEQDDPGTLDPGVRGGQGGRRRGEPPGGHGSHPPLARTVAEGHPVLRRGALRDAVSHSAGEHLQVGSA